MTDLRKLAALRRDATPGSWAMGEEQPADEFWFGEGFREVHGVPFAPHQYADAAYIAAVGSLSAEELDALADVVQLIYTLADHLDGLHGECHCRRKIDELSERVQESEPGRPTCSACGHETHEPRQCGGWIPLPGGGRQKACMCAAALDRLQETTR